jgi:hypothetical protein
MTARAISIAAGTSVIVTAVTVLSRVALGTGSVHYYTVCDLVAKGPIRYGLHLGHAPKERAPSALGRQIRPSAARSSATRGEHHDIGESPVGRLTSGDHHLPFGFLTGEGDCGLPTLLGGELVGDLKAEVPESLKEVVEDLLGLFLGLEGHRLLSPAV